MEAGRRKTPLRIQGQIPGCCKEPALSLPAEYLFDESGIGCRGIWAMFSVGCVDGFPAGKGFATSLWVTGGCYSVSSGWAEDRHPLEQSLRVQVVAWEGRRLHWVSCPTELWLHHWDQGSALDIMNTDRTIIYPWDTLDLVLCGFFESLEE